MESIYYNESETINIDEIKQVAQGIREGKLALFPTETVYGIGANALDENAVKKIFIAKGRQSDNPLIVHISNINMLEQIVEDIGEIERKLINKFWPGPLTIIFNRKSENIIPNNVTAGLNTVGVRMPSNKIARTLIELSEVPIAAPSANTSGKPSPTEASHVKLDLDGKIPMILDGGPVGIGIESTIIDLTEDTPMILRPGYITKEMLEEVLGEEVKIDPGIIASDSLTKPKAPGMKYKHYAPKADLVLVDGEAENVVKKINELVAEKQKNGLKVGVIATDETKDQYQADIVVSIGARADEDAIAQHLYKILREFDDWNVDAIYSESFATPRIGQAIMNRLLKAAGHQVLQV